MEEIRHIRQSLCFPSPQSTSRGGRAAGPCQTPVCASPVLLAWHKLNKAPADVSPSKLCSVLSLIVLRFAIQFISLCPVGFKKQNFSC